MENQLKEHVQATELLPEGDASSTSALMLDSGTMNQMMDVAKIMATGRATIPKHLQGCPADCMAILMQSMQWKMNPFAVAQKTHLTQSGVLGYEAQLINAVVISRAPIKGRPEFKFLGDWSKILGKVKAMQSEKGGKYFVADWHPKDEEGLGVECSVTFKGEDKPRLVTVMMSQAYPRFSTQWATDPQQQITYLSVRKLARRYAPDVILGVYTPDELDEERPEREIGPAAQQTATQVAESARAKPVDEHIRTDLIAELEKVMAEKGLEGMRHHWMKVLTKEQRVTVGAAERDRIAAMEVKAKDDKPPIDPAAPTCADLLLSIDKMTPANFEDETSIIISASMALPEDQREKIAAAIESKGKILNG